MDGHLFDVTSVFLQGMSEEFNQSLSASHCLSGISLAGFHDRIGVRFVSTMSFCRLSPVS
jgi:hypothetical protein